MLPSFLMGVLIFVLIILMFQVLRLTEFALVHGVALQTILEIIMYICISMLPVLFPMSLLFAVILTYGRLSQDSEIVAFRASGLSMKTLVIPAMILALIVAVISAQTSFELAPWGNRQFEVLYSQLANTKAAANIKAGTFSEGFFDKVIYANEVDSENGLLKDIFIYDEKNPESPLTIIAKSGMIVPDSEFPGHSVMLRLNQGDIHRNSETHTKIRFESYDIHLIDPIKLEIREKSPQSLTLKDLTINLAGNPDPVQKRTLETELSKRWAISILCLVFALIGVGLGTEINRRSQKASGLIVSIAVIVIYWILYILSEGMARNGQVPIHLAIWAPNFLFGSFALWKLKKVWD
ncbi:MAG: LPS export ABC transporter permease LptF [Bdellovibrionaceae bacterium]|nr:LPS export ABC transporter permease LptF [Pseudobdellovibrionaceae bacterium]